jgi:hypothetical protein
MVVVWVAEDESLEWRLASLVGRVVALGSWCENRVVVLTNLDGAAGRTALGREAWSEHRTTVVLGGRELRGCSGRHGRMNVRVAYWLGTGSSC